MNQSIHPNGDPREPDLSFRSARLKVSWAKQRIDNLARAQVELIERYRKAGSLIFDQNTGHLIVSNNPIDPGIALAAGDAIFSLRSALDCCWMGLRRAIDANDPAKKTIPRANTFDEVIGTLNQASMESSFKGINDLVANKIRPYKDGSEIIWFIAQVDNWNKHNMLIVTLQQTTVDFFNATFKHPGGGKTFLTIVGDNYVGERNFSQPFGPAGSTMTVHGKPNISIDIILISRKPVDERPLLPFLHAALKETHKAVELFVSTFGKNGA